MFFTLRFLFNGFTIASSKSVAHAMAKVITATTPNVSSKVAMFSSCFSFAV